MQPQAHHPRLNTYHSHKQRVLGHQAAQPAPAWRANARIASGSGPEIGSKILLSRLPMDVVEEEVEVLFSRTVGPVREVLMVYNSQGKSRGMAIVSFTKPGDGAVARAKYNGKIVDGRRPIKIEIVNDDDAPRVALPASPPMPSLLTRLGPAPLQNGSGPKTLQAASGNVASPRVRLRAKKGPRRLNKQRGQQRQQLQQQWQQQQPPQKQKQKPKTAQELDAEMDDYRSHANGARIKVSDSFTG